MSVIQDRPVTPTASKGEGKLYYALDGFRQTIDPMRGSAHGVFVKQGDLIKPLYHHIRHSPTGFAWGYGGSGPAELARCILYDHLGYAPTGSLYQLFKIEHVSKWDQNKGWKLTSSEVQRFVDKFVERNPNLELIDHAG